MVRRRKLYVLGAMAVLALGAAAYAVASPPNHAKQLANPITGRRP